MSIIYVAHGLTSSGKTETANYLELKYGIQHFHPYRFAKHHYERLLQKPKGFLDTTEGKAYLVPGTEITMQRFMVEDFHFSKAWFPQRTALNMLVELPQMLAKGDVCAVSLRNHAEIDSLERIVFEGNHTLVLLNLYRQEAKRETSDENYEEIKSRLGQIANGMIPINNNFTLDYLYEMLDSIVSYSQTWNDRS